MIWEHKKVMLERIKCIENQLGMNSEISDEYKNIVDAANKMRMMYALLQTKKRESILQSLQIKLIILSDGEYKILKDLLKKVKKLV